MNGYYALRWKVLERDKFTCQYCGQHAPNVNLEVDHVITVEDGGEDTEENLKTSCYACNRGRSALRIILKRSTSGKLSPKPYIDSHNEFADLRQSPAMDVIKKFPQGIRVNAFAREMDINYEYACVLIGRLAKRNLVKRLYRGCYSPC